MSNKLITMSKVRSVFRLYAEGVSKQSIAERTGLPRNTVKRYLRLLVLSQRSVQELLSLGDAELERMFLEMTPISYVEDTEKYKRLSQYFPLVEKALKSPGVTKEKLWKDYRGIDPEGFGYTQFKKYYLSWLRARNPVGHIEHKDGDKMYVDYAGDKLQMLDPHTGELIQLEVFVAVLGSSQLTYVEASMSQKTEDFIQSCVHCLEYFQGSPRAIVTDNLKAAVIKSSRYEPVINDAFRDFASHYTMAVLPAGPYKPTHKALVEGAVKIIYRVIYPRIREGVYTSLASINEAIHLLLEEYNNRPMSGRPYSRRQQFSDSEAAALQPLPALAYDIKRRKVATVMKNNFVSLTEDKHYYSVPYRFIGKKVTVLYNQSQVEVYYRYERIALHQRDRRQFKYTAVPEHLASWNRFAAEWNPDKFLEKARVIGPGCLELIGIILSERPHPEQAYRACQGVLNLGSRVGAERLEKACLRALLYKDHSYHTVRVILEKGLDKQEMPEDHPNTNPPGHDNIRGSEYFQ
jgi:transposase